MIGDWRLKIQGLRIDDWRLTDCAIGDWPCLTSAGRGCTPHNQFSAVGQTADNRFRARDGDLSKALTELCWAPKVDHKGLVTMIVDADIKRLWIAPQRSGLGRASRSAWTHTWIRLINALRRPGWNDVRVERVGLSRFALSFCNACGPTGSTNKCPGRKNQLQAPSALNAGVDRRSTALDGEDDRPMMAVPPAVAAWRQLEGVLDDDVGFGGGQQQGIPGAFVGQSVNGVGRLPRFKTT